MEIADVVLDEEIEEEWGNAIRDRTVQRYDDITTRTAENSSPTAGDLSFLEDTGDLDVYFSGAWRHLGVPVGTIIDHGGGSVPTGYLACNGQAVSRTTYAALFTQIGETWGVGDGSTTFNVPDLRGRVARGTAASGTGDAVGETFGSDTHTHTGPSHTHAEGSHNHDILAHGHTGITMATATQTAIGQEGTGPTFEYATAGHKHTPASTGSDDQGSTQNTDLGSTGSGGTGNTGSSSTIQAGAAVNKLIKT